MNAIRALLASFVVAAALTSHPSFATSYSTDQSDLWWNPAESGWGIQFVQRGATIFATMFVYGASNTPTWYTATMPYAGGLIWSGDLYATTGPWFGAVPFNPATVTLTEVGTMTWSVQSVNAGTLTYTVNGVPVVKSLQRQFIAMDDYSGTFGGGVHQTVIGCTDPANNGTNEFAGLIQIAQAGQAVTVGDGVCSYVGTLTQQGQFGQITGTYSCNTGEVGNVTIFEVSVTPSGITGRLIATSTNFGCRTSGWFGGGRHAN